MISLEQRLSYGSVAGGRHIPLCRLPDTSLHVSSLPALPNLAFAGALVSAISNPAQLLLEHTCS